MPGNIIKSGQLALDFETTYPPVHIINTQAASYHQLTPATSEKLSIAGDIMTGNIKHEQ
ncbi:hypothetical protein ACJMK2_026981 [Sinanodonta woodiana]|uniref:Uncharacterized protein n=1 Tax=Sinanodonta woodiana TaxID=1069815 RepID=A0ABD3XMW0_SINWO